LQNKTNLYYLIILSAIFNINQNKHLPNER